MKSQIFSPKVLNRKRIDKILCQIFEVPIFFVSASMGCGKTTAVKSFLDKKKDVQSIWIYSEDEDNDMRMWKRFCLYWVKSNSIMENAYIIILLIG